MLYGHIDNMVVEYNGPEDADSYSVIAMARDESSAEHLARLLNKRSA